MVFVPPRFAADAIYEAADAGVGHGRVHHRGHSRARHASHLPPRAAARGHAARPQLPRRALAGRRQRRHHPGAGVRRGPIGLVSRSGTLTYQIGKELADAGLGNSTIVGIGGDPIVGMSFIDVLERFEADADDRPGRDGRRDRRRRGGEGGGVHRRAHAARRSSPTSPASRRLPARRWATPARSSPARPGPPQAKKDALEARGVRVGSSPTEAAQLAADARCARLDLAGMGQISFTRGVPSADLLPVDDLAGRGRRRFETDAAGALAVRARRLSRRCGSGSASATASTPDRVVAVQRLARGRRLPGRSTCSSAAGGRGDRRGSDLRPHADRAAPPRRRRSSRCRSRTTGWTWTALERALDAARRARSWST